MRVESGEGLGTRLAQTHRRTNRHTCAKSFFSMTVVQYINVYTYLRDGAVQALRMKRTLLRVCVCVRACMCVCAQS